METIVLWGHALAALPFAALAVWAIRTPDRGLTRWPLAIALATLAIWALSVAGLGQAEPATRLAEGLRNLSLLALAGTLHRRYGSNAPVSVAAVYGVVAVVALMTALLGLLAASLPEALRRQEVTNAALLLGMMTAMAALVLMQNLYAAARRSDVRLLCIAVALVWIGQFALASLGYLGSGWTLQAQAVRGPALVAAAGLIAIAVQRGGRGTVQVSRTVAYRSLSLVVVAGYFLLLALGTSLLSAFGGGQARIWQTAFVVGITAAAVTLVGSPWLRAWARVKVAKHLFRHRYDYRAEWARFTGTIGVPEDTAPLDQRVIKAIAEMTESPAGLLLVPDGEALGVGVGWNWPDLPRTGAGAAFARHLAAGDRIVELDPLRRGEGDGADLAAVPQWMLDAPDGWAVVPLPHLGRLTGAILLARPTVDRALDWEDFDLLRIAGRQVASYLAEARAQDALAQAQRFDEFNRRFAFIVHDIKNLVSGLSLVARNAERHADNPAFRADMVATLQDSAARLNMLLARLSAGNRAPMDPGGTVALLPLAQRIAARHRLTHPVVASGTASAFATADAGAVEQIAEHLVRNAVEASAGTEPVAVTVEDLGAEVALVVADHGCGMTPGFVRNQLFRPFVSSKSGGFGIGAFEARQLAEAMGGRIEVDSREGEGTRFRVILRAAGAGRMEAAA